MFFFYKNIHNVYNLHENINIIFKWRNSTEFLCCNWKFYNQNCVIYCNGLDFCSKEWPLIVTFRCFQNINKCQFPYLSALDFCNFPVWNIEFDELDCFPRLNWIFLPALVCEIQVWNRLKIQFIKLDISNWRMSKIKFR